MISRVYWETDYYSVASACILHYELVKYCNCSVVHTLNVNIYLIRPTGLKSDKGFAGNKMRLMNVSIKISFKRFELIHRQSLIRSEKVSLILEPFLHVLLVHSHQSNRFIAYLRFDA